MLEDDELTIDDETIAEKFERVHNHLDLVDRTLSEISRDIGAIINSEFADVPLNINYDIDEGSIRAQIPVEKVAVRVNRQLEPPFFVEVEGNSIIVNDIRNVYNGEIEPNDIVEAAGRKQTKSIKGIVSTLEDAHSDGAPEEQVLKLLTYAGLSRTQAEQELDKLKQKGEVYVPSTGNLRTT